MVHVEGDKSWRMLYFIFTECKDFHSNAVHRRCDKMLLLEPPARASAIVVASKP